MGILDNREFYNGVIGGEFLISHLKDTEENLVPKIGVYSDSLIPQTSDVLNYLNDGLDHGLSLGLKPKQLKIYERLTSTLLTVDRFEGAKELKEIAGGDVASHTLFAIDLHYKIYKNLIEEHGLEVDEKVRQKFSRQAQMILCHDGGEVLGEFGTAGQQLAGLTGKDYSAEEQIFRSMMILSAAEQTGKNNSGYTFEETKNYIQSKVKNLIKLANKKQATGEIEDRDGWLSAEIEKYTEKLFKTTDEIYPNLYKTDKKFIDQQCEYFSQCEGFQNYDATYARIIEKLEGSLHLAVLSYKNDVLDWQDFDGKKNRGIGNAAYMEGRLPSLIEHQNSELEESLSKVLKEATYECLGSLTLRAYPLLNRDPKGAQESWVTKTEKNLHYPRHISSAHLAHIYFTAADNDYKPEAGESIIKGTTKPKFCNNAPTKLSDVNEIASLAEEYGLKPFGQNKSAEVVSFAERYARNSAEANQQNSRSA